MTSGVVGLVAQHDHTLTVPVTIGPLLLRVILFYAVPAVAGFALLRGFLGGPDRRTAALVSTSAAVAVVLEMMLAGRLDLPNQVVFLAFAAVMFPALSAFKPSWGIAPRIAPFALPTAALGAAVEFGRAWLAGADSVTLHSGMILALAGLAWLPSADIRNRIGRMSLNSLAALLGIALIGAAADIAISGGF